MRSSWPGLGAVKAWCTAVHAPLPTATSSVSPAGSNSGASTTQVNAQAGLTFEVGLRSLLRQDPDIIMVGETRDNETADIAVRATKRPPQHLVGKRIGPIRVALYAAAKGALLTLTRALAVELAPEVRVNAVAPGPILWPEDGQFPDDERTAIVQHTLLKRAGTPEDIARTVRFLMLDAPYITGQVINVDGGRSAHLAT